MASFLFFYLLSFSFISVIYFVSQFLSEYLQKLFSAQVTASTKFWENVKCCHCEQ